MQPSHQPPDTSDASEEGGNTTQAPRLPSLFSSHFLQALFLCVVALASAIVQIRGGSRIDAVLATGIGLFLGWLIYPKRLFILAVLVLPLGIINQLYDSKVISGRYIEPAHLLVLALGLLAITWAMRARPAWAHPGSAFTGPGGGCPWTALARWPTPRHQPPGSFSPSGCQRQCWARLASGMC